MSYLTIEEQERRAYAQGDITLAGALAARIDAEDELAAVPAALEELQSEIAHLKRILADALWAARELDAGRALTVEGAQYLSVAAAAIAD